MAPCIIAANNYFYHRGGSEAIYFSEISQLEGRGWKVVPFSMDHPRNIASKWGEFFVNELEFGASQTLWSRVRAAPKFVYSLEAKRKIELLIRTVRPDLCHLHNIYHHLSPSILSAVRSAGIPSVLTLHDLKIACPAYTMLTHDGICERCKSGNYLNVVRHKCVNNSLIQSGLVYLEARLHKLLDSYASNVDRFVVPSQFYRDKFVEWGVNPESLVYIPNSINVDNFTPTWEVGDYFVYVGRLVAQKGIATLVRAAHQAGVALRVVGTGPLEEELKKEAESLGADIEFTGYLSGSGLHSLIANARGLVLPSEGYENAPISVLEAYALGTPVLGADIGGIPELIETAETGFVFRSGDRDDLAAKLSDLREMPIGGVLQLGRNARKLAELEFDNSLHLSRLLQLYASLGVASETAESVCATDGHSGGSL